MRAEQRAAAEHSRGVSTSGEPGARTTLGESRVAKPAACNLEGTQMQYKVYRYTEIKAKEAGGLCASKLQIPS